MSQPNIILIVADDMGYGDFGVFNEGRARTPVLDSLVEQGICLTQHYSASAVCAPAREVPPPPPPQLYNLADDPLEQSDLAAHKPQRVERMVQALERWFHDVETDRHRITD